MKKTAIALVVAGLAAASVAQAAPQENTFYAGVKAGQASFHDGIKSNTDATVADYWNSVDCYGSVCRLSKGRI